MFWLDGWSLTSSAECYLHHRKLFSLTNCSKQHNRLITKKSENCENLQTVVKAMLNRVFSNKGKAVLGSAELANLWNSVCVCYQIQYRNVQGGTQDIHSLQFIENSFSYSAEKISCAS